MRVKKSTKKHTLPPPDAVRLIEQISKASEDDLPVVLSSFRIWRYPRGDLHGWIPVLDHFDAILEGIVTSYDLEKIQINDFTPKTKELLLDILRVHKVLLENCTSRKLFASYDHLNALLLTNDLDVLLSVVSILQRQAATYGHTIPIDGPLLKKIRARLVTLARGSDSLRANGFDLKTLASSSTPNVPDDINQFSVSFYPVQQESDASPKTGQTTLQFEASAPTIQDEIAEAAEKNHMSTDDQLEALVKARWILSLNNEGERQKLLAIRLTALATLWFLSADDSSATLLHYEPDLVSQIADLLAPSIPELVQTAALTALDGCVRTRNKTSEVLTAVGANLSHGALMSLLRRVVAQLVANEPVPHDLVDAALTLTADVVMALAPTQGLPSAGLVPVLLDLLRTRVERRDSYIPRATGLMDALGSNSPQSTAEGVSTLVARVKDEIELLLSMDLPPSSETLSEESIIAYLTNPLRAILRSLHRVQHHGAEGSRNLMDSELPKCLKRIFENWSRLGSKVFVQSINIMASFIHNEPTSLSILQEQQLPQTLLSVMESSVPETFEVMTASCSAIGASCLNTAGLEHVQARPAALVNIIDGAINMSDPNTDKTREVGSALDELARHHPSLRPTLFKTGLDRLSKAIAAGRDFVPADEEKKEYVYDGVQNPKAAENGPLTKLTSVIKLLEGLLRNTAMCDDFIKEGFPLLSEIPALPCLPVAFTTTEGHAAMSRLYRVVGEHDHVRLIQHLISGIKADFDAAKPLWEPESPDWTDKQEVQVLPGLSHRLTFLSDMLLALSYSHQRVAASVLKALGASTGSSFMSELGALHRAAFRQHASYTPQPDSSNANPLDAAGLEDKSATKHSAAQFLSTRVHAMCTKLYRAIIRSLFHKRGTDAAFKKESSALGKQIATDIIKHLNSVNEPRAETVAVGLTTLLLFDDRGPDGRLSTVVFMPFQKAGGIKVLLDICDRIVKRMDDLPAPDPPKTKTDANAESSTEKAASEGSVPNHEPAVAVTTVGAKDTMEVDQAAAVSADKVVSEEEKAMDERRKTRTQATASLRIALVLLGALVSPHSLVDAPQAQPAPDDTWKPHEILIKLRLDILPLLHRIWSADWLVTMPTPVIKTAVRAFSTVMAGDGEIGRPQTAVAGGAANALLGAIAPVVAHVPAVRAPVVADPTRVNQLVDMGFPRASAELALVRARNNVAAATDLILMMPHLFEGEAEVGNAPADNADGNEDGDVENNEENMEGGEEGAGAGENDNAESSADAPAAIPDAGPVASDAAAAAAATVSDTPANEHTATSESNDMALTQETTDAASTGESSMDVDLSAPVDKDQLDELRASYKPQVPTRALVIVDHAEDLVFEVISAFPREMEGIKMLLDHALKCVNEESDKRDEQLAARLRLAAVFIRHNGDVALDQAAQETVCEIVAPLSIDVSPQPRWTCALLLFAEAAFASSESLVLAKIGDEATSPTEATEALDMAVGYLSISIHTILEDQNSTRDELISAMRLLVILTRHRKELITPDTIRTILAPFKNPTGKLSGCQPYVSMIVRHAFEDRETLVSAMRREIRQYLTKNKLTDINHFARQVKHIAARDPSAFVEAVKKECALNDPSPAQSVYHIRSLNESERTSAPAAPADPFSDSQDDQSSAPIMDTLLGELGVAVQTEGSHTYGGLVVALLTEVLGSYVAPKRVFLSSLRRQGIFAGAQGGGKNGLATIVNDVICKISLSDLETTVDPKTPTESSRRLMLSSWASSMLVGLSCDPGGDLKEDAEALTSVRKTILDLVAKSFKDQTANLDPGAKYGRLFALAELVYGLLLVKSGQPPIGSAAKQDTASVQVAKIMLEKSFVGLITAATGEVDLNYPGVKIVLTSLLRALDHLTKVAIKWSKNDKDRKKDDLTDEDDVSIEDDVDVEMDTDFDEEEEDEEGDEEHEAPDLYRNSALGMHMMDEDDDGMDEEGDEDEDMIEGYDEEMDDGMEDDESGTEPSSDEDDDDEEDPEDWTDEEMDPDDGDEIDEGPEVVIGDADPVDEEDWEDEEDGVDGVAGQDLLDRMIHNPEEDDYDEDDMDEEGMLDEMDDLDEMDEMDEEEFDEMIMDHAEGHGGRYEAADPGYWGWGGAGEAPQPPHRARVVGGGPAGALFGIPSTSSANQSGPSDAPAVPALLAEPAAAPPEEAMRGRFPSRHAHELFSTIEGMGGPQAVRMMESLIQRSERSGGRDPIRISFAHGEDGVVDVTIGGRSFPINARPHAPVEPTPADITMELGPKPSAQRWNEEAKLSPNGTRELLSRVVVHMINHLLPAAKKRQEEAEEKRKKEEEAAKKKQEEEDAKQVEKQKKKDEEDAKQRNEEVELAMSVDLPPSRATPVAGESSNAATAAASTEARAPSVGDVQDMAIGDLIELGGEDTEMLDAADVLAQALTGNALGSSMPPITNGDTVAQPEASGSEAPAEPSADASGSSEPAAAEPTLARTVVQIRGRDVDITDSGIDLEFLQALPEDMRADVVEQHLREQNSARMPPVPAIPLGDGDISVEFLDALPPDLRDEVIAAQAAEAARRQRAAGGGAAAVPARAGVGAPLGQPMVNLGGGIMVPALGGGRAPRAQDLLDMPEPPFFDEMPEEMREMMMGAGGPGDLRGLLRGVQGLRRRLVDATAADESKRQPHRESIQLLEKPGIASLTRLLFFPETFKKDRLFRILANLCENSTTRSDLLNLLLSVLQDGSGELPMVDKSFQQMSIKNMATPKSVLKTKTPGTTGTEVQTPGPTGAASGSQGWNATNLFSHLQTENIPTFIAQRCLEALTHILGNNTQAVNFFLTEHEQGVGLRKVAGKKGKGKEKEKVLPQVKYPIVILLGLLERTGLLGTQGVMESLTALLVTVTRPLPGIKVEIEKAEKEKEKGKQAVEVKQDGVTTSQAPGGDVAMADSAATTTVTGASVSTAAAATPAPASATAQTPAPAKDEKKEDDQDKANPLVLTRYPAIPAPTLRLVINALTTGECSSKNFSQTLVVLQNLSCIPDAQPVLLQELQERSQKLGLDLRNELSMLASALQDESFETSHPALTVFSSPSATQAQLLRLLKTIEYIHLKKDDTDPPGEEMTPEESAVSAIYQSFDFDPMWTILQQCLTVVEKREDTKQIALILLPLVEALMVVCKYRRSTRLRDARSPSAGTGPMSPMSPTSATTSLPFDKYEGDLFLSFTTHHRKILNEIVRSSPALLSGSFSLLIHNPRVLEFDNKRQWFFQKLKKKKTNAHAGQLSLTVRRQYVFQDSFDALRYSSGDEIKYGKIGVKFKGEDGIDAGGVTREWYSVLAKQIFDPNFALFEPCAADQQTYQPNKNSSVNGDQHMAYFKFIGRIIGKAVYDGRLLDAYFNRAFYKQILGRTVDMRDLESIDPEYHKSLQWMLDNDITGVIDQEFTIEDEQFGEKKIVELKEGGAEIPVTEENKEEYVRLVVSYRLDNSIKDQIKAFLDGFYDIIPRNLIQIFEPDQLELLISGMSTIDVDELKNATQMSGWKSSDPEVNWFWRALRSFSQEERSRFLMFVTSSSRVPLGGFTQLQGASGTQPFQLQKLYSKEGSLPQASTCFNLLLLPNYASYEQLKERLQFAVTETGGFGKA